MVPGISGAGRTRRRPGKPRPAPVSRPGAWLRLSESDPKTEASNPVAGCSDKTLSRFCPVQKSKNFVSRARNTPLRSVFLSAWEARVSWACSARPPAAACPCPVFGWSGVTGSGTVETAARISSSLPGVTLTSLRRSRVYPGSCGSGMPGSRCPPCKNRIPLFAQGGHKNAENCNLARTRRR